MVAMPAVIISEHFALNDEPYASHLRVRFFDGDVAKLVAKMRIWAWQVFVCV